jgi:hypothetical protein
MHEQVDRSKTESRRLRHKVGMGRIRLADVERIRLATLSKKSGGGAGGIGPREANAVGKVHTMS